MSRRRWAYTVRLVPIGVPVRIPVQDGGKPCVSTFDENSFEMERKTPSRIKVWVDHDRTIQVGTLARLYPQDGWWHATFALDKDIREELQIGQPMSVGISHWKWGSISLDEVSIVRRGAVRGAEIIERLELSPDAKPAPPQDLDQYLVQRVQYTQTRARLEALGIDVTNYRPPLPLHRSEMESMNQRPRAQKPSPSAWPAGTIVRDLPDGAQEITFTRGGPVIRRPAARYWGFADGYQLVSHNGPDRPGLVDYGSVGPDQG